MNAEIEENTKHYATYKGGNPYPMGNCHLWCQIFTFTSVYDIFHLTLQFLPLKGLNIFPGSLHLNAAV